MDLDIHRALVKAMTRELHELGPEPWPKMRTARMNGSVRRPAKDLPPMAAANTAPPAEPTVVFGHALGLLLDGLHNQHPEYGLKVRAQMLERLSDVGNLSLARTEMRRILHLVCTRLRLLRTHLCRQAARRLHQIG
jgi:hypothetical protein